MSVVQMSEPPTSAKAAPSESSPAILVARALQVLDAFMGEERAMSLSDLARRVALPKSTAFRIVNQLTESGYLVRLGRSYQLSSHLFRLGNSVVVPHQVPLREVAAPHLAGLFQHTGFGVNLAVLDGPGEVLYLDTIRGVRIPTAPFGVGATMPAMITALGKVILAHQDDDTVGAALAAGWPRRTPYTVMGRGLMADQLRKARQTGVAFDRQEAVVGLSCVAAAVLDADGRAIGAVSACGPVGRFKPEAAAPATLRAARLISNDVKRAAALQA
ncbi:IclR family transcriptional regulator [Nocardioides sp. zg-536]|uniref:Glycerol operon regulatory protein n=1 Tax=Nocardioides faecalis TaxID=2803858 RepID=A0A938Y8Y9_9ACTN|nr:IclR family transcriptional regulator [Nocardioides faecalis]MBM9460343.1 IclR family transcriptional regulator [Nocardioides faecalis]MBS4751268.1 IclR family transcriptional regulator [Nocardioides faecalis]QVI59829.1 IclR family transcriptional regulator [Nocardioides faecalis]